MSEEYCRYMDKIKCPACGHNHRMDAEDLPWTEESDTEKQCYGCDKVFQIKANVSVCWTTEIEDDGEDEPSEPKGDV